MSEVKTCIRCRFCTSNMQVEAVHRCVNLMNPTTNLNQICSLIAQDTMINTPESEGIGSPFMQRKFAIPGVPRVPEVTDALREELTLRIIRSKMQGIFNDNYIAPQWLAP